MTAARQLGRTGPSSPCTPSRPPRVLATSTALGLRAALAAALDAIPSPAVLLESDGAVLAANRAGLACVVEARLELGRQRARDPSAAGWTVTKVAAEGVADRWLAIARDATSPSTASAAAASWDLTPRQAEVLALALDGLATRTIAARLGASSRTVEVHLSAIYAKAGVASRSELIARALRGA